MGRQQTPDRRRNIGEAALKAFSEAGFRNTQVADIARLAGTAPGTLYLYARSKEALFVMAMETSLGEEPEDLPTDRQDLLATIERKLAEGRHYPLLKNIQENPGHPIPLPNAVFSEIWDSVERLSPTIRLIERCARDWPDLGSLFYHGIRPQLLAALSFYLKKAIEQGLVRQVPNVALAARLIVETTAWFTMHRLGDADGKSFDSSECRQATLDALTHAYAISPTNEERK